MKPLNKLYHYLFYVLVFLIPFEDDLRAIPNLLLIALTVLLPFVESKFIEKLIKNRLYLFSLIFVILICLTSVATSSFTNDLFVIKKLLIVAPLLILSTPIQSKEGIMLVFIFSVAMGNIISLIGIGSFVFEKGNFEISTGDEINNILFVERLYSGILNCLSIAFSLKIWTVNRRLRKILIANVLFCLFLIFLVVSRMAMLLGLLMCFIKLINHIKSKRAFAIIGVSLAVMSVFLVLNRNVYKRFLFNDNDVSLYEKIKAWEPRFVIWNCGFDIFNSPTNNFLFGDGFYNTQKSLNTCYTSAIFKKKKLDYFMKRGFNTHNQYLDFLISKGIFGLFLFTALIFLIYKKVKNDSDLLNVLLVLLFYSLIENIFHRQIGAYLTSLIIVVIGLKNAEINE